MSDNSFEVLCSKDNMKSFLESSIKSSEMVLEHYDFVINDISSHISDAHLEATKEPTIEFLNKMRKNWLNFRNDCEMQLRELDK